MAALADIVKQIIEETQAGNNSALVSHLAEDAVINIPMRGEVKGKGAIVAGLSMSPRMPTPPGTKVGEPEVNGDTVKVHIDLPPGQLVQKLDYVFTFEGELIKRLDISI